MRIKFLHIITPILLFSIITFISCGGGGGGDGDEDGVECIDGSGITSSHWAKTYDVNTAGISTEFRGYINHADDGGYILAGSIGSSDFQDENSVVMRLDAYGNVIWAKVIDVESNHDFISSIQNTMDGGYIAHGAGYYDYMLLRLDSDGNVLWQKFYSDGGNGVSLTSDGGYVVSGKRCVFKTNADGDIEWSRTYSGGASVYQVIKQTKDGGYIIAKGGAPVSGGTHDAEVIKLDVNGDITWAKKYMGEMQMFNVTNLHETDDGGYIFSGAPIIKLDSMGNVTWAKKIIGGDYPALIRLKTIQPTTDGGYIIVGDSEDVDFDEDIGILRLNQDGEVIWQKSYGGSGTWPDYGKSIIETNDGEYVISGVTMSFGESGDIWVLKIRPDGTISPDAPSYLGADINTEIADISLTVSDIDPRVEDCTVTVSDVSLTVTDVGINVCAQAWD